MIDRREALFRNTMALVLVRRLRERLLVQTEIDASFSEVMFSFMDEGDREARKQLLEEYWGLKQEASGSSQPSTEQPELADDANDALIEENSSSSTPPTPPGEYDAESLLVEQIEAAVSFAVDKLFLHYEIYQFVSFFNQTLAAIGEERQDSKELPTPSQVLELFESSLVPHYASKITDYNFLEAVDYIKTTIFQHFHLYQFLLTQEQPIDLTSLHLPVEVLPSDPLPLTQGIEEEEFKRRERVGKLEEEHALREKELVESQTKAQADLEEKVKKTYKTELAKIQEEEVEGKLISAEELSQIVDSLMSTHLDVMTAKVTHAMQRHALALNSRLEKIEILSSKHSNESLSSSPSKLGPPSPSGKKSRNPSRLSNSTTTS